MDKVGFKLAKINTEQFAIIDDAYDSEIKEFNLETTISFGVDLENSGVISSVKIQFEQDDNPFLVVSVSCEFKCSETIFEEGEDSESTIIKKGFLAHMTMITVGTLRGVLHAKTENTKFNEFFIPTLNVQEMISKDGIFKK